MATRYRRFRDISVSERLLDTLFLLTIGIGYLFALTHIYYSHSARDGKPGLSVEDVRIAYYGAQDSTRLEAAINGIMEANLSVPADKQKIINWLHTGKSEEAYNEIIAPIFNRDCVSCHNPAVNASIPNLTDYQSVMEVSQAKGASLPTLVKVSHIHLFGIAFILFFVGKIFILSEMNSSFKRVIVIIPFLAMLIDILSWIPARTMPAFAYIVVGAGGMMGLSMMIQIAVSLYQMWIFPFHPSLNIPASEQIRVQEFVDFLHDYGYEVIPEGNGWLVKESLRSWQFLHSIDEIDDYVKEIKARHQAE
jgi:hypothetical protein